MSWGLRVLYHGKHITWHSPWVLQGTQEVPFQEEILKCVLEMEPSVAWLSKMINTRCRHGRDNDYPGWRVVNFDYESGGLRPLLGGLWEQQGLLRIPRSPHSPGSCAHSEEGSWPPPASAHPCPLPSPRVMSWKTRRVFHNLKNLPNFQEFRWNCRSLVCLLFSCYPALMFWLVNEECSKPQTILSQPVLCLFV